MDYAEALRIQEETLYLRQQGLIGDVLILVEHPHVLTIGTSGNSSNILISEEYLKSNGIGILKLAVR
jgi:lipoyl(octanoyl) transferase